MRVRTLEQILGPDLVKQIKLDNVTSPTLEDNIHPDVLLFREFAYRVPKGWSGFNLGAEIPHSWVRAITRIFRYLANSIAKNFTVHYCYVDGYTGRPYFNLDFKLDYKRPTAIKKEKIIRTHLKDLSDLLSAPRLIVHSVAVPVAIPADPGPTRPASTRAARRRVISRSGIGGD